LASVVHPPYRKLPVALLNVSIVLSRISFKISKTIAFGTIFDSGTHSSSHLCLKNTCYVALNPSIF
jgi:hypothetical protein